MPPSSSPSPTRRSLERQQQKQQQQRPPQHPHHQQQQPQKKIKARTRPPRTTPRKWTDDRSRGHSVASNTTVGHSAHTPTSVAVDGTTILTRDLSDLSGSYLNGNTMSIRSTGAGAPVATVPKNVYPSDQSTTSYQRPWRQAQVLSSREPVHPQPPRDCDDSIGFSRKSKVMVGPQGIVEVVRIKRSEDDESSSTTISDATGHDHHREPLLILLMDPGRKVYEVMQLWIDVTSDTVRDVLHAVQLSLADKWRQDYDGLFHVRNNTFTQLIHILSVDKYEVQPLELWVAKPWAMSAKTTISYASSIVEHLKDMGVLDYLRPTENSKRKLARNPKADDLILTLSQRAQKRVYSPEGVLKHHHAFQFLTFSPPFEANMRIDVLADSADSDDGTSQFSESLSHSIASAASLDEREDRSAFDIASALQPPSIAAVSSAVVSVSAAAAPAPAPASASPSRSASSSSNVKVVNVSKAVHETLQEKESSDSCCPTLKVSEDPRSPPPTPVSPGKVRSKPRGIARLFAALNCAKSCSQRSSSIRRDTEDTMDESPVRSSESRNSDSLAGTALSKVWEDESFASQSVTSDSRPLLQVRSSTSTAKCSWDSHAAI